MAQLFDDSREKPKLEDYEKVFGRLNDNKTAQQLRLHFESCRDSAASQLLKHPFWIELKIDIENWDAEYRAQTSADGLYKGTFADQASLHRKSWESLFNKIYRKNVLKNPNWPKSPEGDWVKSDCMFEKVGDILRTQLISRYIDGVQFIVQRLSELAAKHSLRVQNKMQATAEGYYAGHVDIEFEFQISDMQFNPLVVKTNVEFQVTTQLKEVVKQLLHVHYEKARIDSSIKDTVWQWEYLEPNFDANYLGHVVHYLEAQIVKLRDHHVTQKP